MMMDECAFPCFIFYILLIWSLLFVIFTEIFILIIKHDDDDTTNTTNTSSYANYTFE